MALYSPLGLLIWVGSLGVGHGCGGLGEGAMLPSSCETSELEKKSWNVHQDIKLEVILVKITQQKTNTYTVTFLVIYFVKVSFPDHDL